MHNKTDLRLILSIKADGSDMFKSTDVNTTGGVAFPPRIGLTSSALPEAAFPHPDKRAN